MIGDELKSNSDELRQKDTMTVRQKHKNTKRQEKGLRMLPGEFQ